MISAFKSIFAKQSPFQKALLGSTLLNKENDIQLNDLLMLISYFENYHPIDQYFSLAM